MGFFIETERHSIYERIPHRSATKLVCRKRNTAEDVACLGFLADERRNISYFFFSFYGLNCHKTRRKNDASVFVLKQFRFSKTAAGSFELIHMESLLQM
ncbi:hypothetical protein CDAR_504091 [Caerostris darwini]|uniref:Uncharacterized protein n=1 Tax=Caerostris darwini TaxID=1538125 RepID=A0AAV4SLZ2_9ARAC|nr:hypothetical protein CDAR_504091 [Caerostris darwini]